MSSTSGSASVAARGETILVPLALRPVESSGDTRLPVVARHARAFGAEVVLLHVLDGRPPGDAPTALSPEQGVVAADEAHARVYLDAVAARVRRTGVRALPLVRRGHVASVVRDTASEQRARLIVIGRAPRRGLARLLHGFGSSDHTDEIARAAPCPVLVVQPPDEADGPAPVRLPPGKHAVRRFDDDAIHVGPIAPHVLGIRTVEVSRIVGTVPALDLRPDFRPARPSVGQEAKHRGTVALMATQPESLPPVGLYKLGYGYYVFSGHAQVAAARELGQAWTDASVTEYVPVEDMRARQVLDERGAFERATGITGIGAALPGTYARLAELIDQSAAGSRGDPSAAARWKSSTFRPLQRRLRELRLNQHFPGERSADIIVRIAAFREHESERHGTVLSWEAALAAFAEARPLRTA